MSLLATALALSLPAAAAERSVAPKDALAVGGASFAGGLLGAGAGFGAGLGVAQGICYAGDQPDGAWGCTLASTTIGATSGYIAGSLLAAPWVAGRRGLDDARVRRRSLIVMGAGLAVCAALLPTGLGLALTPALLVAVPIGAASAAGKLQELSVAPILSGEVQGLALSARF